MIKRIFAILLALFMVSTLLCACAGKEEGGKDVIDTSNETANPDDTSSEDKTPDETNITSEVETELKDPITYAPVSDGPIDLSRTGATENMLIRSVCNEGDLSRLALKLQNALDNSEDKTTLVFLGDSIFAGSSASGLNQFANQVADWWEYSIGSSFDSINASIGATDSYLAVHRAERDVLSKDPDIIFIEYINDKNDSFYKSSMDSLVKKCLSHEGAPAVILVEMALQDGSGGPGQVHTEVGRYYDVPVISYHNAVMPEVNAGNIAWKDIAADNVHPNDMGHSILSQLVTDFLDGVISRLDEIDKNIDTDVPESALGYKYENAHIVNRESAEIVVTDEGSFTETPEMGIRFTNGWGTSTGGKMTFEIEAKNLGIVYNKSVSGGYGVAKVIVDGVEVKKISDADFTGGWGSYARTVEVYSSDKAEKHTVTIEIEGTAKPKFDIYSLLVS